MNLQELRTKDDKALMAELERARKEKLASKLSLKMRQSKDSHAMKEQAVKIAQIEMLLMERRREQNKHPSSAKSS